MRASFGMIVLAATLVGLAFVIDKNDRPARLAAGVSLVITFTGLSICRAIENSRDR